MVGPLHRLASLSPRDRPGSYQQHLHLRDQYLQDSLPERTILDVGCGTGQYLKELHDQYGPVRAVGCDVSSGMVADARFNYPQFEFVVSNITRLPFSSASFDVVTCTYVFHHLPLSSRRRALAELQRVAREAVIIQDVFGFDSPFPDILYRLYYTLVDGSYHRFRLDEWYSFLGDSLIANAHTAEDSIRLRCCTFVIRPSL